MNLRDLVVSVPALVLAVACVLTVWRANAWEAYLVELLMGFGGLTAFVFAPAFNEWQGSYGWHRGQWWQLPEVWTKVGGAAMLGLASYSILIEKLSMFLVV